MTAEIVPFLRGEPEDRAALEQEVRVLESSYQTLCAAQDQAGALRVTGRLAERLRLLGDLERAQLYAERHHVLCLAVGSDEERARGLVRVATVRQFLGHHEAAEPLFREASRMCDRLGIVGVKDFALQHFGKCLVEMGRLDEAADCFKEALRLRQKKNDASLLASTREAIDALSKLRAGRR